MSTVLTECTYKSYGLSLPIRFAKHLSTWNFVVDNIPICHFKQVIPYNHICVWFPGVFHIRGVKADFKPNPCNLVYFETFAMNCLLPLPLPKWQPPPFHLWYCTAHKTVNLGLLPHVNFTKLIKIQGLLSSYKSI